MKRICIVFVILCTFFKIFADEAKFRTLVLDFEDRTKQNSKGTLSEATEYLKFYLKNQNIYQVVQSPDSELQTCKDKACKLKVAKKFGVDLIATPYITAGKKFAVNVEITNVKNNSSFSVKENWNGQKNSLETTMDKTAQSIAVKHSFNTNITLELQKIAKKNKTFEADDASCRTAQSQNDASVWEEYLKKYPEGICMETANEFICQDARSKREIAVWEAYVKKHQKGPCLTEAQTTLDTLYCEKARKNADEKEWKQYISKFPIGSCVTEAKKMLETLACENARKKSNEKEWKKYLKEFPEGRCIQDAKKFLAEESSRKDNEACEKARNKSNEKEWKNYLKDFPEGQCTEEAKKFLDEDSAKKDTATCEETRKKIQNATGREKRNSANLWKKYLKEFPQGQCAEEAESFIAGKPFEKAPAASENAVESSEQTDSEPSGQDEN